MRNTSELIFQLYFNAEIQNNHISRTYIFQLMVFLRFNNYTCTCFQGYKLLIYRDNTLPGLHIEDFCHVRMAMSIRCFSGWKDRPGKNGGLLDIPLESNSCFFNFGLCETSSCGVLSMEDTFKASS